MRAKFCFCAIIFFLFSFQNNFKNPVIGNWVTEDNRFIINISEIRPGVLEGKILWMLTPKEKNGNLKKDKMNPDAEQRNKPLLGQIVIRDLKYDKKKGYNGKIYHPKTGKSYDVSIHSEKGHFIVLIVKGSFLSRTLRWKKQK